MHRLIPQLRRACALGAVSAVLTLGAAAGVLAPTAGRAAADDSGDPNTAVSQFLADVNHLRASKGLRTLALDATLTSVAAAWNRHLIATTSLSHNPSLRSQVPGSWTLLGENVGRGPTESDLFSAFVASPSHYRNLVEARFTRIGIAVAMGSDGRMYTTHDFEAIGGTATPPPPAPSTTAPPETLPTPTTQPGPPPVRNSRKGTAALPPHDVADPGDRAGDAADTIAGATASAGAADATGGAAPNSPPPAPVATADDAPARVLASLAGARGFSPGA